MEMNKTGRLIEQLRKEKCMTQSDLAAAVGVSKQAVSNWEWRQAVSGCFAHRGSYRGTRRERGGAYKGRAYTNTEHQRV